jgi:hypothetical protein
VTELFTVRPNEPVNEVWVWQTDLMISDDGTEQRTELTEYPRRETGGAFAFDNQATLNRHLMGLTRSKGNALNVPFFQYSTALTAAAAPGAMSLFFSARTTQVADADYAMLYNEAETVYELVALDTVGAASSSLAAPLGLAWPAGSYIAPVHLAYARNGALINRANPDGVATIQMSLREVQFHAPFLNPLNAAVLDLLGGSPILNSCIPVGSKFRDQVVDGSDPIDYGGAIEIRSRWQRTKLMFERTFRVPRTNDFSDWEWWFQFADYIRGSRRPFWLPSYRQDFTVVTPPAPSGTTLTVASHFFRDYCFSFVGLRGLFIETDAGIHFALATAVIDSGTDDAITFAPALPAGAGWDTGQKIGFLYKCRLQDDRMTWAHYNSYSYVDLNILTTDD